MSELVLSPFSSQHLAELGAEAYDHEPISEQRYTPHPFHSFPVKLVVHILCIAASHYPGTHASLRLTASEVRTRCQPHMRTAVIIKRVEQAVAFAHFMIQQRLVPFHIHAL